MKGRALMFGLNYSHCKEGQLQGCINDCKNMAEYLTKTLGIPVSIFTDEFDTENTSKMGLLRHLYELAVQSYREDLDFIWIHYSGHGSYLKDTGGDEKDGEDECLVPCDYHTNGFLLDDEICKVIGVFNPKTRIVCVFDSCHSGTVGDVKYSWESATSVLVEDIQCKIPNKIITLSGCLDNQTSADAFNVLGDNKSEGAMTSCLLKVLKANPSLTKDVFGLLRDLRAMMKQLGFSQVPKLCSTHNLAKDKVLVPL